MMGEFHRKVRKSNELLTFLVKKKMEEREEGGAYVFIWNLIEKELIKG